MKKLFIPLATMSSLGAGVLGAGGFVAGNMQAIYIAAILYMIALLILFIAYRKGWFYE